MNSNSQEFLLLIILGVLASANNIDLANNTTILLLLAWILFDTNNNGCGCGCNNNCNCNNF